MSEPPGPRQPKCTRCRHHGIITPQKGHSKSCPYLKCVCWKCHLITERTRIAALQRNLRRKVQDKEQQPRSETVRPVKPVPVRPVPGGGAPTSVTSIPKSAVSPPGNPLDLRYKPAHGEAAVVNGLERKNGQPLGSSEGGLSTPSNTPNIDESNQNPPLPVIGVPFQMPGPYPNNFILRPNVLLNMMWFPAVDLCNNRLPGPVMFPHYQPGAMHHPPPYVPGSPSDYRELTHQPPLPPEASKDGKKL